MAVDLSVNHVSLEMICMSYYGVLWITKPLKKETKIVRGGDSEFICPRWHVDLFLSCRRIHRNLYIGGNHCRSSCWTTISRTNLNQGFPPTPKGWLTRQSPQLSPSQVWSPRLSIRLYLWARFCLCSSEIAVQAPLLSWHNKCVLSTIDIFILKPLYMQLALEPEKNWIKCFIMCICAGVKHWKVL